MQKSGPGTEAQSESISSGDRNLIQVILLFIPHLTDLKDFSTSLTLVQTSQVLVAPVAGTRKSWCGIFGPLGMDSENTRELKYVSSRRVRLCFLVFFFRWSSGPPLRVKTSYHFLSFLKRILCNPQVGLPLETMCEKENFRLLKKTEILLSLLQMSAFLFINFCGLFLALQLNQYKYKK